VPVKDRPRGDTNSGPESANLKDSPDTRIVSIPIGSDPDVDDDEDTPATKDVVVERWLNGYLRVRV